MHRLRKDKPLESDWWVKSLGRDIFVKYVLVFVPTTSSVRKTQPIGVLVGKASVLVWDKQRSVIMII